jgi:8-oxo-dGTP pyrophosphatase MutT (NUDIX family)
LAEISDKSIATNICAKMPAIQNQVFGCILEFQDGKDIRYLCVKGRKSGKWSFPKGHPDNNEEPYDCAIRELMEETGLVPPRFPMRIHQLATGLYYHYRVSEELIGCPEDTAEVEDLQWLSAAELRCMPINVDVSTFLKRVQRKPTVMLQHPWRNVTVSA